MNTTLPSKIRFEQTELDVIHHNGQRWLTVSQIGLALESSRQHVNNLWTRHRDEFTDDMSSVIQIGRTRKRIFSPRGCHLIGMFARTPKAKAFRVWVLDVLEQRDAQPAIEHQAHTPATQRVAPLVTSTQIAEFAADLAVQMMEGLLQRQPEQCSAPERRDYPHAKHQPGTFATWMDAYGPGSQWDDPLWQLLMEERAMGRDVSACEQSYHALMLFVDQLHRVANQRGVNLRDVELNVLWASLPFGREKAGAGYSNAMTYWAKG